MGGGMRCYIYISLSSYILYIVIIDNNIAFPPSRTQSIECGEDNHSELLWLICDHCINAVCLTLLFQCTYRGVYVFNTYLVVTAEGGGP